MAKIVLEGVTKLFKGKESAAVYDLDLEVEDGEFLVVVGPSGCGKTTTLRMLAGFEVPSKGVIRIGNKAMNSVLPKDRNLAMVFQNYALFPHMSVQKNLEYGMRVRNTPKSTMMKEIGDVAEMLGISPLLNRKPSELSGGERQRVALGRALLRRPEAFLLDEPLSNLDAALRAQMRIELKRIHAQFPVTTVYVTHDQVEAMTMADRVVLMQGGRLQQVAAPEYLYDQPANAFVASFIGSPKINMIPGSLAAEATGHRVEFLGVSQIFNGTHADRFAAASSGRVSVGFRPEDIRIADAASGQRPVVNGRVELVEPLGSETHVIVRIADHPLTCKFPARCGLSAGDSVALEFDSEQIKVFDADSGTRLA